MFRKSMLAVFLMVAILSCSGCIFLAAGAAGVGTAKWLSDKQVQQINVPKEKAVKAAVEALKAQNANVYKQTDSKAVTQIKAKDIEDRQIWVDLHAIEDNITKVEVRVGYANGQTDAAKILQSIVDKAQSWL